MKAIAVYPGKRALKPTEHQTPMLTAPSDVMIRILEACARGMNKEICALEYGTRPQESDSLVIGHEALGESADTGPAVTRMKRGYLVVATVRRTYGPVDRGSAGFSALSILFKPAGLSMHFRYCHGADEPWTRANHEYDDAAAER
jgi:threonine dehydrogenase-like Zn-dependent dehydrogenase